MMNDSADVHLCWTEPGPAAQHVEAASGTAAEVDPIVGGPHMAVEGGLSDMGALGEKRPPEGKADAAA